LYFVFGESRDQVRWAAACLLHLLCVWQASASVAAPAPFLRYSWEAGGLRIMSQKRRIKAGALECQASGIRGEYELHGAEEFYQSQGSAYSNPHEDQLKIGVPRCFGRWKEKLPIPFVSEMAFIKSSPLVSYFSRDHCLTLHAAAGK
jgi:hypothetical protein